MPPAESRSERVAASGLTWEQLEELSPELDPISALLELVGGTQVSHTDRDEQELAFLVNRWPQLPEHIRQAVMTLARTKDPQFNSVSREYDS